MCWVGVTKMFKAPLYDGVLDDQFQDWAAACLAGTWEISLVPESYIEFSKQEDLAAYLLAFYHEPSHIFGYKGSTTFDSGAFYCPYVPLTVSNVSDNTPPVVIKTRSDL